MSTARGKSHPLFRILWLDDNIGDYRTTIADLVLNGYIIRTAQYPLEAMKIIREEKIDVVLLDYRLHGGVGRAPTGLDVLEELIYLNRKIRVAFLTAHPRDVHEALNPRFSNLPILAKHKYLIPGKTKLLTDLLNSLPELKRKKNNTSTISTLKMVVLAVLRPKWTSLAKLYSIPLAASVSAVPLLVFFARYLNDADILEPVVSRLLVSALGIVLVWAGKLMLNFKIPDLLSEYPTAHNFWKDNAERLDDRGFIDSLPITPRENAVSGFDLLVSSYDALDQGNSKMKTFLIAQWTTGVALLAMPTIQNLAALAKAAW